MVEESDSSVGRPADGRSVGSPERSCTLARRRLLTTVGGGAVVVLAGCFADDPEEEMATYVVVYLDEDELVEVETREDEAMLYPALEAGVDIPYSCEVGRCGQCTARYDGDANDVVVHEGNEYLDDDQIADGWVLTCVAYARDDFDLEVAHPENE